MPQNCLEFSEVIDNLTPEEIKWWNNEAEKIGNEDEDTRCYDYKLNGNSVWFHSYECGNVEAVALVVQAFLAKFRINDYFSLTWACWCHKPSVGEFYGGAIFVTSRGADFHGVHQWLFKKVSEWEEDYGVEEPKEQLWMIANRDEKLSLYWAKNVGWVDKSFATKFNVNAIGEITLPVNGQWESCR